MVFLVPRPYIAVKTPMYRLSQGVSADLVRLSPRKHHKGLPHHLYMVVLSLEGFASAIMVDGGLGVRITAAANKYRVQACA
jgi:hypothetical protein